MATRAINHAPIMNVETGRRAALRRDTETGEWVVWFYRAIPDSESAGAPRWQYLGSPADYFTDDKEDAYGTAEAYCK
ncbi:hypothetical protein IPa1_00002 [Pseudomonas phage vB_PpuP-IPa-1]